MRTRHSLGTSALVLPLAFVLATALARSGPLDAAVVVFANHGEQMVQFSVEPMQNQPTTFSLAPRKLVPVRTRDTVRVEYSSGGRQVRHQVEPNTVQCFAGQPDGVQLQQIVFSHFHGNPWLHVDGQSAEPATSIVPVKLVVDDAQAESRAAWEARLRGQLAVISGFMEQYCAVRFEVVAVDTWQADKSKTELPQMADDFRQKVNANPAWLAIGFTSRIRVSEEHPLPHQGREPFVSHLLLPDVQEGFSSGRQLQLLAHELGHFLGAAHSADDDSLMRSSLADARSSRRPSANTYDPINTLVMNLIGEEIRSRRAHCVGEISRSTRQYLVAIYRELGARLPGDGEVLQYAALFREPVLPRLRYLGQWVDGSRLSGDTVAPWHDTKSAPQLAGRALLDTNRHLRWLLDDTLLTEAPPPSWIEFVGGDCLPGRVVGAAGGSESPALRLPPHLEVSPYVPVDWPDGPSRPRIRVSTSWIRRIVWQPVTRQCQPQTLFYRDGRQIGFRSVRFAPSAIQLLREEGIQEVSLEEVAELHMPRVDAWESYFDQLAALVPTGEARLMQVETTGGLRATGSSERFQAKARGGQDDPNNWHHLVQPAWSLDALWIPHRTIRLRRYFLPQEVPLSRIDPAASRQESDLGGPWPWRVDRNVEGGPLASGGQPFSWGFGVHATSELEFLLPGLARAFQARLGLDQIAGDGGCVRAKVFLGSTGSRPLFESPLIIGSTDTFDTGRLGLDSQGQSARRLILQVDAVRQGRPAAADPFGIRATFDWLEPLAELDAEKVKEEVLRRAPQLVPAWQGWKVAIDNKEGARLVNYWDETAPPNPVYRLLASAGRAPLTLSAKLRVRPDRDRLLLAVNRAPQSSPSKIEVRIEGKPLVVEKKTAGGEAKPAAPFEVPIRHSDKAPEPLLIPLEDYQGRQIQVELVQTAQDEKSLVQWDAIALVARPAEPGKAK